MVVAVAFAVSIGVLVQELIKLVHWYRARRSGSPTEIGPPPAAGSDTTGEADEVAAERL
jgi:hypothetical protein